MISSPAEGRSLGLDKSGLILITLALLLLWTSHCSALSHSDHMTRGNLAFVEVDEDWKTDEVVEAEFAEIAGGEVDEEDGSSTWRPLCS